MPSHPPADVDAASVVRAAIGMDAAASAADAARSAIVHASVLVADTVAALGSSRAGHRSLTHALRALSELERSELCAVRVLADVARATDLLAAGGGLESRGGQRADRLRADVRAPAQADAELALRVTARTAALAETAWHSVHAVVALVREATRAVARQGLASRMEVSSALDVARIAARHADALLAGTTNARWSLVSAVGAAAAPLPPVLLVGADTAGAELLATA